MQNCMDKYKNEFAIRFAQKLQDCLPKLKAFQNEKLNEIFSLNNLSGYFVLCLGSVFLFFVFSEGMEYSFWGHIALTVLMFVGILIAQLERKNKLYQTSVKKEFFPTLLQVFDDGIVYSNHYKITNNTFEESLLFSRNITERTNDDMFGGVYNDVHFWVNETHLTNIEKRLIDNGRDHYHHLFKGVAMGFKLNKDVNKRILILSKNSRVNIPANFERVRLEYPAFTKKYDVWVEKDNLDSSGQIEARYLLNVLFLERFMQLKTSFKVNKMTCSVYGDTILVLLYTNKDVFEMNHLFGKIDDPRQYKKLFDEFASVLSFMDVLNLASKTKL